MTAQGQGNAFIFFLFIALVVAIVVFTVLRARRRMQGLMVVARQIGFTFKGDHWPGPMLSHRFKTTILQRMRGQFRNVMVGSYGGLQVALCDYTYAQTKSRVTTTLACFQQQAELPPFALRPENFFDKIGDALLHNDIDFDSNPEFSQRYHLGTPNEKAARMLFNPSLLSYFEQIPPDRKWYVEASGPTLVIYRRGLPVGASDITSFLDETSSIARTILTTNEIKVRGV